MFHDRTPSCFHRFHLSPAQIFPTARFDGIDILPINRKTLHEEWVDRAPGASNQGGEAVSLNRPATREA